MWDETEEGTGARLLRADARTRAALLDRTTLRIHLPNERGTHKTVTAIFWPLLELFSVLKILKPFQVFPLHSAADFLVTGGRKDARRVARPHHPPNTPAE